MIGIERTMYKILIAGLAIGAVTFALNMVSQIDAVFSAIRTGYSPVLSVVTVLSVVGRFLLALAALYWVPKAVLKLFPEVS